MARKVPLQLTLNGEERAEFIESGSTLLHADPLLIANSGAAAIRVSPSTSANDRFKLFGKRHSLPA